MEATYKTKDVTNKTGIPKHIVRKYSQLLEEHGYIISKQLMLVFINLMI